MKEGTGAFVPFTSPQSPTGWRLTGWQPTGTQHVPGELVSLQSNSTALESVMLWQTCRGIAESRACLTSRYWKVNKAYFCTALQEHETLEKRWFVCFSIIPGQRHQVCQC